MTHYFLIDINMDWTITDKKLTKEFLFNNFSEAMKFINQIEPIANTIDHHPDILIHSYKKVKIYLFTHSENKITGKDFLLAEKIDMLFL